MSSLSFGHKEAKHVSTRTVVAARRGEVLDMMEPHDVRNHMKSYGF